MKQFVFIIFIGLLSFNNFAQNLDFPQNPKPGKSYIRCHLKDGATGWVEMDYKVLDKYRTTVKDSTSFSITNKTRKPRI